MAEGDEKIVCERDVKGVGPAHIPHLLLSASVDEHIRIKEVQVGDFFRESRKAIVPFLCAGEERIIAEEVPIRAVIGERRKTHDH